MVKKLGLLASTFNKHNTHRYRFCNNTITMQGGKSIIKLKSGDPPLEVNRTTHKATDTKTGVFTVERYLTYTVGKRVLSMTITEMGCAGCVDVFDLKLSEQSGKGSNAYSNLRFIRDNRYGILCNLNTELAGSYYSFKENYCLPPLPDTELIGYLCRETGSGSWLTLAKKKDDMGSVEKVKVTHAFIIDAESSYNVSIKLTNNKRVGLNVEVEAPVKMTMDYNEQLISTIREKVGSQMEATILSRFNDSMCRLSKNGINNEIDNDGGRCYKMDVCHADLGLRPC